MRRLRAAVRSLAESVATVLMMPMIVWFHARALLTPRQRDRIMRGLSQAIALLPGTTGSYLRSAFYRRTLWSVGRPCFIGFGTIVATADISVGDRVYVGAFCNLGHVDIADDVMLGSNVTIISGKYQHGHERTDVPMNRQPGTFERVRIGRDCWLGNGSIVMVDVAPGCVVAAGAIVTATHPELTVLAGSPAKVIATRGEGRSD